MGQKKSRKIPAKFPTKFPKFPCGKSQKIRRRASAGVQGEETISDFSSRPWRNFPPPPWVIHIGDLQASPQHADPHGLGAFIKKTIQEVSVDRRGVYWSAGRHVDHPCGGQISQVRLARKVRRAPDYSSNLFPPKI